MSDPNIFSSALLLGKTGSGQLPCSIIGRGIVIARRVRSLYLSDDPERLEQHGLEIEIFAGDRDQRQVQKKLYSDHF